MEYTRRELKYSSILANVVTTVDGEAYSSPLHLNLEIDNTTNKHITVGLRNGLVLSIKPTPGSPSRCIIGVVTITQTLTINANVKFDIRCLLNADDSKLTPELQRIKQLTMESNFDVRLNRGGSRTIRWRYEISLNEIDSDTGSVYLNNLDIMLSTQDTGIGSVHPYSLVGFESKQAADMCESGFAGFLYALTSIDNSGNYGDRYVNLLGRVYLVPSVKVPGTRNGLYVNYLARDVVDGVIISPQSEYICFTDTEHPIMRQLYLTKADAAAFGDVVSVKEREYKLRIGELQYELQLSKIELSQYQAKIDREKMSLEVQRERQEQFQKQLDYEMTERLARLKEEKEERSYQRKEQFEYRQNNRKDATEMFKMIPIIIGFLMAIKPYLTKK